MYLSLTNRLRLSTLIAFALLFSSLGHAQIDAGSVVVGNIPKSTPVMARSSNSKTFAIVQTAFRIHGGFDLVGSPGEADFVVAVEPVGASSARLVITSGVPEQTLFSETLPGDSSVNAVYRAIDRAIFKTRKKPGFFAGKLAFVSEETGFTEVCVSDLLFQNVTQLTQDRVSAVRPHWSPDGSSIVYTSYKKGFPDIYRLDLVSQKRQVIANYKGLNTGGSLP